jgi:hypothetical protein
MCTLSFTLDRNNTEADFLIEYIDPNVWNDLGYYSRYNIFALPSVSGRDFLYLGKIRIISTEQKPWETNALLRLVSTSPVFYSLPNDCHSLFINEGGAKLLFQLLSPSQREQFCDALKLCLTLNECRELAKTQMLYQTLFRSVYENRYADVQVAAGVYQKVFQETERWERFDKEMLLPVRKYLRSELTVDNILELIEKCDY